MYTCARAHTHTHNHLVLYFFFFFTVYYCFLGNSFTQMASSQKIKIIPTFQERTTSCLSTHKHQSQF